MELESISRFEKLTR
jgi:hypothetical protein